MAEYFLHSAARARHNRGQRSRAPGRATFVHKVEGLTVRRSRPVKISEERLQQLLPQISQAVAHGRLEVRTGDGRLVDLSTFQAVGAAPAVPPQPNFLLDSAAFDKPAGGEVPAYYEGKGPMAEVTAPEILPSQDPEESVDTDPVDPDPSQDPETPAIVKEKRGRR